MAKPKVAKRRKTLFDPDKIATAISQNLNRDLSHATQMYGYGSQAQRFFSAAQQQSCLKKYDSTVGDVDELEKAAFSQFLETNERMREVNDNFRPPRDIPSHHLHPLELLLKRARALVHWTLRDITWGEIADNVTHSSGVTRGVSYSDTSLEAKYTWPMSSTTEAASLYRQYLSDNTQLKDAIEAFNRRRHIVPREIDVVEASRATTVPKTSDKRRMIAIEPTVNMYFQQALMAIMYDRLKDVGLDVECLPFVHKRLAREGSITGNLATIDFSSASDCVSIELLRYLLPQQWFRYVTMVRCPKMEILGETVDLNMVSTMGNAGTFPLETLVFWALGVGAVMQRTRSNPYSLLSLPEEREAVSVFGDDCILPTVDAVTFMDAAEAVGFIVNREKSFFTLEPGFRESCGGDYFRGEDVRPFYVKAPTSTRGSALEPWLYVILNAVLKKYISYFGPNRYIYDKALLEYLFGLFTKNGLLIKLVPSDFPDDSGLKTLDWRRIELNYGVKFDTVGQTDQGWCSFRYLRFQYRNQRSRDDHLRYVTWLKRPIVRNEWWVPQLRVRNLFPIRRKGGYIVARTTFPNWGL